MRRCGIRIVLRFYAVIESGIRKAEIVRLMVLEFGDTCKLRSSPFFTVIKLIYAPLGIIRGSSSYRVKQMSSCGYKKSLIINNQVAENSTLLYTALNSVLNP